MRRELIINLFPSTICSISTGSYTAAETPGVNKDEAIIAELQMVEQSSLSGGCRPDLSQTFQQDTFSSCLAAGRTHSSPG